MRAQPTLVKLNQRNGFDCPGCAWPETPGHRKHAEFCENGAKAVAEEATRRVVDPDFFDAHPASELRERTDYWLGQQGRITEPMVLLPGATHYTPITGGSRTRSSPTNSAPWTPHPGHARWAGLAVHGDGRQLRRGRVTNAVSTPPPAKQHSSSTT